MTQMTQMMSNYEWLKWSQNDGWFWQQHKNVWQFEVLFDLQFKFLKFLYFSNSIPAAFNTDISKSIELFIE